MRSENGEPFPRGGARRMAFSGLRNAPKNTHFSRLLSGKKVSNNIVPLSCRGVNLDSLAHGVLRLSNGVL